MEPITLLVGLASGIFAGGAAWGGSKKALNGTRARVVDIEQELKDRHKQDDIMIDRMARLETKVDILIRSDIQHNQH